MNDQSLKERWQSKTPKFWKKIQRWAIVTGSIAGVIIAAPLTLPAAIITTATYLATISATIVTTAQLTVENKKEKIEMLK